jgi:hypothetical protein
LLPAPAGILLGLFKTGQLMILQRISQTIRQQSWSTLFIELVVLVLGIFIGLQVDAWNTLRQDRSDEQVYLQRLQSDLLLADDLTSRVRDRLVERHQEIKSSIAVLFGPAGSSELSDNECAAVASSVMFNSIAPRLAAFDELVGTGRLGIIRDPELLGALIRLEQSREALAAMVSVQTSQSAFEYLPAAFPQLIETTAFIQEDSGEVRIRASCDLPAMQANTAFLNQFTINADGYDAFTRDGLLPWKNQFDRVRELLDAAVKNEQ